MWIFGVHLIYVYIFWQTVFLRNFATFNWKNSLIKINYNLLQFVSLRTTIKTIEFASEPIFSDFPNYKLISGRALWRR